MKYKIGDRVVVCRLEDDAGDLHHSYLGKSFDITRINPATLPYPYWLSDTSDGTISFGENELEFEHIYNSPLYKALS